MLAHVLRAVETSIHSLRVPPFRSALISLRTCCAADLLSRSGAIALASWLASSVYRCSAILGTWATKREGRMQAVVEFGEVMGK